MNNHANQSQQEAKNLIDLLAEARRRLVETGTRNRLIHVNREAKRANALNIVNERSNSIFEILRIKGRKMKFKAMGRDKEVSEGDYLVLSEEYQTFDDSRYLDLILETPLGPDALQKLLLRLHKDAKTAEEEQGVNILYLAMGFLRWFEDKSSAVPRDAPLILIPVTLKRNERGSSFDICVRDEDIVTNLPLQERLSLDFGIALPEIDDSEDWTPGGYFERVLGAIEDRDGWEIDRDGMQLGFFSFAKLLMLNDLDPKNWPAESLYQSDLLRSVLRDGFDVEEPLFGKFDRLDARLTPSEIVQVVDADASQTKVIQEVRTGRSLVVQGPPGTGKSQTITNIIASAIHDGKTVLFVAEKMAALDVVHNRLVAAGLSEACLELHSRFANKRAVLNELGRTLNSSFNHAPNSACCSELATVRTQLNAASSQLHDPVPKQKFSAFSVMGEISYFVGQQVAAPSTQIDQVADIDDDTRNELSEAILAYSEMIDRIGPRHLHPFNGVGNLTLQPPDQQRLERRLQTDLDRLARAISLSSEICECLKVAPSKTFSNIASIVNLLGCADSASHDAESYLEVLLSHIQDKRLGEALKCGEDWKKDKDEISRTFYDLAFETSLAHLRPGIAKGINSVFSRIFGRYRRDSQEFSTFLCCQLPKTAEERLRLLDALAAVQKKRALLAEDEDYLRENLGVHYRGERTNFSSLASCVEWLQKLHQTNGTPSLATASAILAQKGSAIERQSSLKEVAEEARRRLSELLSHLRLDDQETCVIEKLELEDIEDRLKRMSQSISRYPEWVDASHKRTYLRQRGLSELVDAIETGSLSGTAAVNEFNYSVAEARWKLVIDAAPEVAQLGRLDRHKLVENFQNLEQTHFRDTATKIKTQHISQLPKGAAGQMGFLRAEIARKRGHRSIRRVIEAAGGMVQRIKPVFLMSPISVAQFLKPGSLQFDLLVIDEASQVRPEDALGAIARAAQIVVVGDRKQLPPTNFFGRLTDNLDDDEDEEVATTSSAVELESILTACEARGLRSAMLEWHYRSRDPSLIQVSNLEFYDSRLVLPPSPAQLDKEFGLRFVRVGGEYSSKSKGTGRANTNRIEAEEISQAVATHAAHSPEMSLGVVAFSKPQADIITEVLEVRRRTDSTLDNFLREGRAEDVFVKNIENVQGDERDVIMISVGYGPHTANAPLPSMHFGPINGDGGGRRLNVLFSRARIRCDVFCSFDPSEIDPRRTTREGPRILKKFLEFAKTRQIEEISDTGLGADSPFEEDVAMTINSLGYPVDFQVGSSGFRIDLGVRHPDRSGQYILAVECDGATYHSSLWARERDRLRQSVLEGLGWRFHRIWSTDWFHRRNDEKERLRKALEEAVVAAESGVSFPGANRDEPFAGSESVHTQQESFEELGGTELVAPRYVKTELKVNDSVEPHEVPNSKMAEYACIVVEKEGPIHSDEVVRRVASAFGKSRAGARIQDKVRSGLELAYKNSNLRRKDEFWFSSHQATDIPVRNRSEETSPTTKAEYISAMEIEAAVAFVKRECGELEKEELVRAVCRLLGFQRAGPELQSRIIGVLKD